MNEIEFFFSRIKMRNPKIKRIVEYSIRGAAVFGLSSIFFCIPPLPFFLAGFVLSGASIGLFLPTWKRPFSSKFIASVGFGLGFTIVRFTVILSMIAFQGVVFYLHFLKFVEAHAP